MTAYVPDAPAEVGLDRVELHVPSDFGFGAVAYAAVWFGADPAETSWWHPYEGESEEEAAA